MPGSGRRDDGRGEGRTLRSFSTVQRKACGGACQSCWVGEVGLGKGKITYAITIVSRSGSGLGRLLLGRHVDGWRCC